MTKRVQRNDLGNMVTAELYELSGGGVVDLGFTAEQEAFRQEVRAFLASSEVGEELDRVHRAGPREEPHPEKIYRWLGERGWLAPSWPTEYGGLGRSAVEAAIVAEEMSRHGVPDTVHVNTIEIVGLFLLLAGTPEQKRRFLPPMARGETIVSVLYTEPGVGSDLSALRTSAERAEGGFRISGTKIYSLKSHLAEYGLCAARTRPGANKYQGITLFMLPLRVPEVRISPIWNISDERFNQVVLDGVWVGEENVVGEVDGGWALINAALAIERTGLDYYTKARRWLDAVIERARATGRLGDPAVGPRLAELDAKAEAARLLTWRMIAGLVKGQMDDVAAAVSKWYCSEIGQEVTRLGVEMEGLPGTLSRWDGEAPMDGIVEAAHREVPGLTISAGTSEMMLYLIAGVGLEIAG
jgi:alkylation response protein AidB-like acyl-CoA dehydrogenase